MSRRATSTTCQLVPVTTRLARWQPVVAAALLSGLLLWWQDDRLAGPAGAIWLLRTVSVLLGAGIAFALDDRARVTLTAAVTPVWRRAALSVTVVGLPAGAAWAAAAVWAGSRSDASLPYAALALETVALWALVLAVSGFLVRWRDVLEPGIYTGPLALGLGLLIPQLPSPMALAVLPGPAWDEAHLRWAGLLVCAVVVLTSSLTDPGRRGVRGWATGAFR